MKKLQSFLMKKIPKVVPMADFDNIDYQTKERTDKLFIACQKAENLMIEYTDKDENFVQICLSMIGDIGSYGKEFPIAYLEQMVKIQQAKLDKLTKGSESTIVALMFDMNQTESSMTDGSKIKIKDVVNVSQKVSDDEQENEQAKEKLAEWLVSHKYGDLVKGKWYLPDTKEVLSEVKEMIARGLPVFRDVTINTNSLKSTLKEHIKPKLDPATGFEVGGELPPPDTLKTSIFTFAKVIPPKVKR